MSTSSRLRQLLALLAALLLPLPALAQARLAEGFAHLPENASVAVMPIDVELFSISAGGVLEPQAEWTTKAHDNLKQALLGRKGSASFREVPEDGDDQVENLNRLHGAVGDAISMHHIGPFKLPTKEGKLDWSLGEDALAIRTKTGADYALFTFVRDSYVSGGRVAAMMVAALLGVALPGGAQVGYASLVDLSTGNVVWFNRLLRVSGDLREPDKAQETLKALLTEFPE